MILSRPRGPQVDSELPAEQRRSRTTLVSSQKCVKSATLSLMNGATKRLSRASRAAKTTPALPEFLLSQLRKAKGREQVAAVCFRVTSRGVQFLLVQTRGGRWTFPKGGIEPGLTQAQAAALEAFEEAGVHGRMEECAFASYVRGNAPAIHAHLCHVGRRERPQESGRKPTWFPAEKAKRRLQENRNKREGSQLARVVDIAVDRIRRVQKSNHSVIQGYEPRLNGRDPLQKVQFEAPVIGDGLAKAAILRYRLQETSETRQLSTVELSVADCMSKGSGSASKELMQRSARALKGRNQLLLLAPPVLKP